MCVWWKWDVRGDELDLTFVLQPRTPRRMIENIGPGHGLESSRTAGATSGCMQ